jgi:hypothetical protein
MPHHSAALLALLQPHCLICTAAPIQHHSLHRAAAAGFDAQFQSTGKEYHYRLASGLPDPLQVRPAASLCRILTVILQHKVGRERVNAWEHHCAVCPPLWRVEHQLLLILPLMPLPPSEAAQFCCAQLILPWCSCLPSLF